MALEYQYKNTYTANYEEGKDMLTLLFVICALAFAGRIVIWSLKAAWGISKLVFTIALLPVIIIGAILAGLVQVALPFILIGLIISFFVQPRKAI